MVGNEFGTLRERFERKFVACPMSGCWLWQGAEMKNGYGKIHLGGQYRRTKELAHRAAYELFVGTIPAGLLVLHRCDVPSCVNPAHLFLGTHDDNMLDMSIKGRGTTGERCNFAKLTRTQVSAIRGSTQDSRALAEQFAVSESQINRIVKRSSWRAQCR